MSLPTEDEKTSQSIDMSVELQDLSPTSADGKFSAGARGAARSAADSEDDTNGLMKSNGNGGGGSGSLDRKEIDMHMEPSADDVKKALAGGMQFMKHAHGKALSTKRQIWYKEISGAGFICWQPPANSFNYDPKRCVPISSIKAIYLGKQTRAFGRRHSVNVNDECAFSLETDRRTLDLEAESRRTRDSWLKQLKILLSSQEINFKYFPSPNSKDDDKEIMDKRGAPVKFQIHVRCKNLPRRLEAAELDSVCVGFEKLETTGRLIYLAQSDQIKENDSPAYGTPLILPYYVGAKQIIKVAVYAVDGDSLAEDQQIGFAQLPFSSLVDAGLGEEMPFSLKSNDPVKNRKLQENKSQMFLTCTPALLSEAELLAKMQRIFMAGDSFYLYHSKHPASRVLVFFRKATHDKPDMIYWCRDNTVDKNGKDTREKPRCVEFVDCCMPLLSITDIFLGRQTAAFERPPANKAPTDRCFSFKSSFQGRVLDLQAKSPQVRDAWVFGLMALVRQTQRAANKGQPVRVGAPPQDRLQLHNEPLPPRKLPIPHSHNFKCTLAIIARNLPDAVDPLVGVFLKSGAAGKLKFVDHTETMMDKSNPVYTKRLIVDYGDAASAPNSDVRLTVYNVETPQIREKDTLGTATVSITQLLDSYGREIVLPLNNPRNKSLNRTLSERKAVVVVRNLQALPSGIIELKCACRGLSSLDGNSMGSKHWVLVAYESLVSSSGTVDTKVDEKLETKVATRATSATVAGAKNKMNSVPVKYTGQTECLRDSSAGAADFKKSLGPFEYRGGDGKLIKLAIYVTKDDSSAGGIRDFTEKQAEAERVGTAFINLDNLMISGEQMLTIHLTNTETPARGIRLKHDDAHIMVHHTFKPHNPPPVEVKEPLTPGGGLAHSGGLSPTGLAPMYRAGGSLPPTGGTVSAAALNAALAGQGNAVGTVSIPAIIQKLTAKMTTGRSFIQYLGGTSAPIKINVFYRDDNKTGGTLYWHAAGTDATPNPATSISLESIQHLYNGKQFPALAAAPVASDTLFSIVSPTQQLHLQCNNNKTREQWVFGIMGVLQAIGSNAKLHQETPAAAAAATASAANAAGVAAGSPTNAPARGTIGTGKKSSGLNTAKSALAASKGAEIAVALALPTLPSSTQKMLAVMFGGKKFIRYPFGAGGVADAATVNKVLYRATGGAGAKCGTLYWADVNVSDTPDLNALASSSLPVHTISDVTVGAGSHPYPPIGATVQSAHCVSFVSKASGVALHLEAKDVKQATLWAKTIHSLLTTAGQPVTLNDPTGAIAASAATASSPTNATATAAAAPTTTDGSLVVATPVPVVITPIAPLQPLQPWTPPPPPATN